MTSRELDIDNFVSQIADYLHDRGLADAVQVCLEAGRPLTFLGGQLLWILQPVMGLALPKETLSKIAVVLEDKQAVNLLISNLAEKKRTE